MKLTDAQEKMLIELAEPNANNNREWAIGGSGPRRSAESLVRLGLARQEPGAMCGKRLFSLTPAGRERAIALLEERGAFPSVLPAGTRWHDGRGWRKMPSTATLVDGVYVWMQETAGERWEAPLLDVDVGLWT